MVRGGGGSNKVDMMSPSSDDEKTQVVGRQIWRVVPMLKDIQVECSQEFFLML